MGKRKGRSLLEERRWLSLYEEGTGVDKIAEEAHRALSTVWKGIQVARREREEQSIREGLLRTAYQQHQEDLLGFAKLLSHESGVRSSKGLVRAADRRTRLLAEGLESHLPSSRLWQARGEWEEAARALDALQGELGALLDSRVRKDFHEIPKDGLLGYLWCDIEVRARGGLLSSPAPEDEGGAAGRRRLPGDHLLGQWLPDGARLATAQKRYADLRDELGGPDSPFLARVRDNVGRWLQAREAIDEEVEVLLLRRMLPGRCRLCPGAEEMGTGKLRGRRRLA